MYSSLDDRGFSFTAGFSFIIADCSLIAAFLPVDLSYLFIFLACLSFFSLSIGSPPTKATA
ncbi:membrane protein [Yersinia pestis Pestoides F]|nr:membrane protein [Yersinia pestis Pestoides F]